MILFTEEILNQGKSRNGFWSNKQIKALGLTEIKKGWKKLVIGKKLPEVTVQAFLELKDKHLLRKENVTSKEDTEKLLREPTKPHHIILTKEIFDNGKSNNGGWSIQQLKVFGIIELKKGWKRNLIGSEFSIEAINRFLQLKNKHLESKGSYKRAISYDRMGVVNLDIPVEEQYKNTNWLNLREQILRRDNYSCVICKKKKTELHVHHMIYPKGKFIWEIDAQYLVVVCKTCHENIHDKKLNTLNR